MLGSRNFSGVSVIFDDFLLESLHAKYPIDDDEGAVASKLVVVRFSFVIFYSLMSSYNLSNNTRDSLGLWLW
jgi:hypothetical protein